MLAHRLTERTVLSFRNASFGVSSPNCFSPVTAWLTCLGLVLILCAGQAESGLAQPAADAPKPGQPSEGKAEESKQEKKADDAAGGGDKPAGEEPKGGTAVAAEPEPKSEGTAGEGPAGPESGALAEPGVVSQAETGGEPQEKPPVSAAEPSAQAGQEAAAPGKSAKPEDSGEQAGAEAGWGTGAGDFFAPVEDAEIEEAGAAPPGQLTLDSFFRTQEALWIERLKDNALSKARQNLDADLQYKRNFEIGQEELRLRLVAGAHLEYDFAYLHERDSYDQPTLDAYEWQIIPRETFIALSYEALELTFGSQVVTWGRGTVLSPVDIVNPRDFREPFLVDLEDMRIPILATRLGIFIGEHRLESMLIHESSFWLIPPPLAPFSPMRRIIEEDPQVAAVLESKTLDYEQVPGRFVNKAQQFLQRWSYSGHGFDLALYAGSVLESQGVYRLPEPGEFLQEEIAIESWHPRYTMVAHSGSTPVSELVLNWELGVDIDRSMNVKNPALREFNLGVERYTQLVGLIGIMYEGIVTDGNLIVEYEQHFVFDNPERANREEDAEIAFLFPQEQPRFAFRWTQDFLHERLVLDAMIILFGIWDYTGWVGRGELTYEFVDAWKVGLGYATFQPNDENGPIYGLDSNDRVSALLRWDFLLE